MARKTKKISEAKRTGGDKTRLPGGGARRKSPEQVKKESHHPHEREREERPVLGTRNGLRGDEDPVGPRRRVAGSTVGYKHGKMEKGDGTEKGVWLGPHNSPGSMGRHGAQRVGREG